MKSITQELANFATRVTFADLPESVVRLTKRTLLDSVGCALGGYVTDKAKIVLGHINELGGNPQASIIGDGKTSWALASFANAELINALDFDPLGPGGRGHVSPYVIPPCLAVAERVGASGKELLTAVALAHEISHRFGRSIAWHKISKDEPPYYEDSPRFSYTFNIFGAVAGAAKLLGLDEQRTANAFGIGGASTPVPAGMKWQHTGGPAIMTKYGCWTGWVAQLATEAVLLAERGFTGDNTILDGEWGFWKIYGSPFFKSDILLDGMGKVWDEEMWFKAYPCCGCNHTGIDGINQIVEQNEIKPEEIEKIVIKGHLLLLTPSRSMTEIISYQDTQFSNAYIFAVAAFYGRKPGVYWQAPSTFKDPKIVSLMKKVKVELYPQIDELLATEFKVGVNITGTSFRNTIVEITAKGKKFTTEVTAAKGYPANPMTDKELKEKFRDNAYYSPLTSDKVERLIETIYELDKVDNIAQIGLTS